jgi:hypothetical protein
VFGVRCFTKLRCYTMRQTVIRLREQKGHAENSSAPHHSIGFCGPFVGMEIETEVLGQDRVQPKGLNALPQKERRASYPRIPCTSKIVNGHEKKSDQKAGEKGHYGRRDSAQGFDKESGTEVASMQLQLLVGAAWLPARNLTNLNFFVFGPRGSVVRSTEEVCGPPIFHPTQWRHLTCPTTLAGSLTKANGGAGFGRRHMCATRSCCERKKALKKPNQTNTY